MAQASLLEPAGGSPVTSSIDWVNGVLLGQLAIGLCVIAVAFVGALMLTGRLPVREGMRVVLGCFILLGAPAIAAVFMLGGNGFAEPTAPPPPPVAVEEPRGELPPADYDPYAGASLRGD